MRMNVRTTTVSPTKPFSLEMSSGFLCRFPATLGEQITEPNRMVKAWRIGDQTVAADVSQKAGGDLEVRLISEAEIDDHTADQLLDRVTFYLSLDDDVAELYSLAEGDGPFGNLIRRARGYHQVKIPSPGEHLCWAILAQRVPMALAKKMKASIVARFGNVVEVDGKTLVAFPSVEQLATLLEEEWMQLVGNARKATYLFGSIQKFAKVPEVFLRKAPFDDVEKFLLSLPGIGPWSASFLMVRGLGRMDRMPADAEALRAASRVYGRPVDEAEFQRLADRYGEWRGYWGHYLRAFA
ncbi:DNA-3-methyladenine glycosylase family protein [Paenarthrobacter sp. NPDC089675]|uniref:DNA-3-methyladenine glycosylase family protein n=1 Tax=Paenarthrobacter sp. NPDC089675 TaxID=3364376 RepID=UPI0037FF9A32